MSYREVIMEVDRHSAELLSDALLELGVLSVCIENANTEARHEEALFDEPEFINQTAWMRSRVIAMLSLKQDPTILLAAAANKIGLSTLPVFTTRDVHDQDWVRLMQSQFNPIHIGQKIWVIPSWHDAPEQDAIILEINPEFAFGTGSHPTTCLCMEWIEQYVRAGDSVLDYGCGSGILAILACKFGASPVVGIDIDRRAIEIAQYNSKRNHVEVMYGFPKECPENKFDIVIANILSNPLQLMAPMLTFRVKPGKRLALSGVLTHQANKVIAAYSGYIELTVWRERDGWVCLAGQRLN
ncbi:50S ribosomal protein L11 methyltransferase [Candidatus Vallotiella sp. (ex Adelges kitamiensis)]|uniref:50S ribosomal protein L11 methyltransferase n=1 Tax=Candidatus Vallotiella sp. (ex Adelges kitamiensis) TaxID=2864217 RepID=UPI001CE2AD3B|nr:50S ribosomal protein L11 methyltransferase [Candidatus Vallotia sp. (ex Adelges kitamiensis)]